MHYESLHLYLARPMMHVEMSRVGYTLKWMLMWNTYVKGGSASIAGRKCCGVTTDNGLEMDGSRNTLPVYTVFQYTTLEQSHKMSKSGSNEKFPQLAIQIQTAQCIHSIVCHHSDGHGHSHDSLWCSKHSHSLKQTHNVILLLQNNIAKHCHNKF
jgi:hypothetical protein